MYPVGTYFMYVRFMIIRPIKFKKYNGNKDIATA